MRAAVCTIVAKNYLSSAQVLMESVRLYNPELLRIVILVDRIDGYFEPGSQPFTVHLSQELNIPNPRWFHFKYSVLELSTAVKPYAMEFLFERYELDKLIYLDADIKVYSSLHGLLNELDSHSILLTPHLTDVLDDGFRPTDLDILRCGSYNLGFIGLSSCPETHRFLKWWRTKLYDHCLLDPASGLFVDQRLVDLVPGLFDGVGINRVAGNNVGYWNLNSRKIEKWNEGFTVNGEPLCFFHFSGFDATRPEEFSRHQNRFRLSTLETATREIVLEYRNDLLAHGFEECRTWPYAYGQFANGFPIADASRRLDKWPEQLIGPLEDPFSQAGYELISRFWNQPMPGATGSDNEDTGRNQDEPTPQGKPALELTRIAWIIYESRPELKRAFPDPSGRDSARFLVWFLTYGKMEHALQEPYLAPLRSQWSAALGWLDSPFSRAWYRIVLAGASSWISLRRAVAVTLPRIGLNTRRRNAAFALWRQTPVDETRVQPSRRRVG